MAHPTVACIAAHFEQRCSSSADQRCTINCGAKSDSDREFETCSESSESDDDEKATRGDDAEDSESREHEPTVTPSVEESAVAEPPPGSDVVLPPWDSLAPELLAEAFGHLTQHDVLVTVPDVCQVYGDSTMMGLYPLRQLF